MPFNSYALYLIMSETPFPACNSSSDVHVIALPGRTVLLIGTAHISQESVDLVRTVIEDEKPDCVCIELDDNRYRALSRKEQWQALDLKAIIKKKQLSTLLISLLMAGRRPDSRRTRDCDFTL